MEIKDIKIKDYAKLVDKIAYDIWIDKIEPSLKINGKTFDIKKLTLDEFYYLKRFLTERGNEQNILDIFADDLVLNEMWFFDFIALIKGIADEVKKYTEIENSYGGQYDSKMVSAGIERLNKFGLWNTKVELGEQFGFNPEDIGNWKYLTCLQIIGVNSIRNEIRTNLNK